jgi:antitoxin (DNA-binding transcriptional repressor) of toxin-antitoxin stability system
MEVPISEFKAKCLALLEEVRATRKPIRMTRHGKPVGRGCAARISKRTKQNDRFQEGLDSFQG